MSTAKQKRHPDMASAPILSRWQDIVEIVAQLLEVPAAVITHAQLPYIEVVKASHTPGNPYDEGLCAEAAGHYCEEVIKTESPLLVPNAVKDDRWRDAPEIGYDMICYMGFPVFWPNGDVFGTICVLDSKEHVFPDQHRALLENFGRVVEDHLLLITRNAELEQQMAEVRTLRGIIPICTFCKRVRTDEGFWRQVEDYVSSMTDASFSHSLCPECMHSHYPGA